MFDIKKTCSDVFLKTKFMVKDHSPELLLFAGIAGMIGSTVLACVETLKVKEIVEENQEKLKTTEDQKDITKIHFNTVVSVAKEYAPSLILGGLSITSLVSSNNILRKRNAALVAAYGSLSAAYTAYRSRVEKRFGKEVEDQIYKGIESQEVFMEEVTDENGKKKNVKKKYDIVAKDGESDYVKYFKKGNPYWAVGEDDVYYEYFFNGKQSWLNDRLKSKGFLTLNEAYQELGFEETKTGLVVGWMYDPKDESRDNYVELKVKKAKIQKDDGQGFENCYVIDFNVDGNIYDDFI